MNDVKIIYANNHWVVWVTRNSLTAANNYETEDAANLDLERLKIATKEEIEEWFKKYGYS